MICYMRIQSLPFPPEYKIRAKSEDHVLLFLTNQSTALPYNGDTGSLKRTKARVNSFFFFLIF